MLDFAAELSAAAEALGFALDQAQLERFAAYRDLLKAWNRAMNLVGDDTEQGILYRHFVDCLAYVSAAGEAASVIDVGTGAGLPGVVFAIAQPERPVVLLESNVKRATFLEEVVRGLDLEAVTVVCARAEEAGRDPELRDVHEVAVARRVAELGVLLEYTLPLVAPGGRAVLAKGEQLADELAAADGVAELLGAAMGETVEVAMPEAAVAAGEPPVRRFVTVPKREPTPEKYPRRPGRPSKKPLGKP